jgi:hypothetical protein
MRGIAEGRGRGDTETIRTDFKVFNEVPPPATILHPVSSSVSVAVVYLPHLSETKSSRISFSQ